MPINASTPFAFGDNLVRTMTDENGNPWFVVKDVCQVLELDASNVSLQGFLDDDEKDLYVVHTPGGEQEMLTISESGLYALVCRSRKPEAKHFFEWVRSEVLPALRRTGAYRAPQPSSLRRAALPSDLPIEAVKATFLYEAMRRWHRGKVGDMPYMRVFGEIMGYLAPRIRSNGSVYRDIALKTF